MKTPDPVSQRIEEYLQEIQKRLKDKPIEERRSLIETLRRHIQEGLQQFGHAPTLEDVNRLLAEMDDPSEYSEAEEPPAPKRGNGKWFLLALAFLAVNTWAVWKMVPREARLAPAAHKAFFSDEGATVYSNATIAWEFSVPMVKPDKVGQPATEGPVRFQPPVRGQYTWQTPNRLEFAPDDNWPPCLMFQALLSESLQNADGRPWTGGREFHFQTEPLQLDRVEQADLSPDRAMTVRLLFNAAPDPRALSGYLFMSNSEGRVTYELCGAAGSNVVLVKTGTLSVDDLIVRCAAGLPPLNGSLGLAETAEFDLKINDQMTFLKLQAESPSFESCLLNAYFSQMPEMASVASYIEIQPPIKISVSPLDSWWSGVGCILRGDFQPGKIYTIKFKSGLRATSGAALTREIVRHVQFPDRPSSLAFAAPGRYLAPEGRLLVPGTAVNVHSCALSCARVLPDNLVQMVMRESGRYERFYGWNVSHMTDKLTAPAHSLTNTLPDRLNEELKFNIDLRELSGEATPRGAYLLSMTPDKGSVVYQLVVITDLGLGARRARDGVLVWVNSLRAAQPVSNTTVMVYAENGRELARGVSDASGLAFLKVPETGNSEDEPLMVVAQTSNDLSYLGIEDGALNVAGAEGERAFLADGYEAFLFTDRGIYRPAETLHLKALVRDRQMTAPKSFPVVFRILRPDGRVFKDVPTQLDDMGSAELSIPLPDYLPTGQYTLLLALPGTLKELGRTAIALEEFVPPQIRVKVDVSPETATLTNELTIKASAEHLFGRPAAGLPATARLAFETEPFEPKAWAEYTFGDEERKFEPLTRELGQVILDDQGAAIFHEALSPGWKPPAALKAVAGVTVIEASGRAVTMYASARIDAYPYYLGLKTTEGRRVVKVDEDLPLDVVSVAPDGSLWTNTSALKLNISRMEWATVLRRGADGRYAFQSERVLSPVREELMTLGAGQGEHRIRLADAGEYLVQVVDPDSDVSASMELSVSPADQEWFSWSREHPDAVELQLDREEYKPGDTAHLLIKAPFDGLALLTVESDQIHERRLVRLEKNTAEVQIKVNGEYVPGVYCNVTVLRPAVVESVWSAHRAAGMVALKVSPPNRQLKVGLTAPETIRPQSKLNVQVKLSDEDGAPVRGRVTIMAVDEAICMLTDFATPDPYAYFTETRWPGVSVYDIYSELMPLVDEKVGGPTRVGGDTGELRRRLNPIRSNRFKPVALWAGSIQTDSNGVAQVALDVPEFTGELRLMAVAETRTQAGSEEARVKVKRPLVVQVALPRFLAPGDKCQGTVEIFNKTGHDQSISLQVTCGGPLSVKEPSEKFELASGASKQVQVTLTAANYPGQALCEFHVEAGPERYDETIELPIRPTADLAHADQIGALSAGEQISTDRPEGWLTNNLRTQVWCSGQPVVQLGGALEALLTYPYGCLEQTVSGAFPLLYFPEMVEPGVTNSGSAEGPQGIVNAAILRVLSMQTANGGFGLWPGSPVYPWGSLYAGHFLLEAKNAGYSVPDDRLSAWRNWVRGRLDMALVSDVDAAGADWQQDMEERAYACRLLALAKQPDAGWAARLEEVKDRLNYPACANLAAALIAAGEPRSATELLERLGLPPLDVPRRDSGSLSSPIRDAALLLSVWLEIAPDSPQVPPLVDFIQRGMTNGLWSSTQENSASLVALGQYMRQLARQPQAYKATMSAVGVAPVPFDSAAAFRWTFTNGVETLQLHNDGPGRLYYRVRYEGVPATDILPEGDVGLTVRREWYDANGQRLENPEVSQGQLVVVKIIVNTQSRQLDNLVITDLLPAGFEIENAALATSQRPSWIKEVRPWWGYVDMRDDRLLIFSRAIDGEVEYYYSVRAVTPGEYVVPPVSAAGMYDPSTWSRNGRTILRVTE